MGRKPKNTPPPPRKVLGISLNPEELRSFRYLALAYDQSVQDYLRKMIRQELVRYKTKMGGKTLG